MFKYSVRILEIVYTMMLVSLTYFGILQYVVLNDHTYFIGGIVSLGTILFFVIQRDKELLEYFSELFPKIGLIGTSVGVGIIFSNVSDQATYFEALKGGMLAAASTACGIFFCILLEAKAMLIKARDNR